MTDLYLESAGDDQVPGQHVVTREQAEAMVRNAWLVIEHWEDRSKDLRQLLFS